MTGAAAPADPSAPAGSAPAARGTSSAAAAPAIVVDGLRKAYAGREILGGITFDVRRGELFALLGPNGAGKTTTVEIIEGYRRARRRQHEGARPGPGRATAGASARASA